MTEVGSLRPYHLSFQRAAVHFKAVQTSVLNPATGSQPLTPKRCEAHLANFAGFEPMSFETHMTQRGAAVVLL